MTAHDDNYDASFPPQVTSTQSASDDSNDFQNGQADVQMTDEDSVQPEPFEPVSGPDKERIDFGPRVAESAPIVEVREDHEIEPEVEKWVEKLKSGEEVQLPEPVTDDQGEIVVADASAQIIEDKIVLPISFEEMSQGKKQSVYNSGKWLAVWVERLKKILGPNAVHPE
jgi:hypothetical protein